LSDRSLHDTRSLTTLASSKIDNPQGDSLVSTLDKSRRFIVSSVSIGGRSVVVVVVVVIVARHGSIDRSLHSQFELTDPVRSTRFGIDIVGGRVTFRASLLGKLQSMGDTLHTMLGHTTDKGLTITTFTKL
jgi:hypothetical protein